MDKARRLDLIYFFWAIFISGCVTLIGNALPTSFSLARSLLALVAMDGIIYTAHLFFHRVPFLWELHKIHHSSEKLSALSTFRSHLISQVLMKFFPSVFLLALGFQWREVFWAGLFFNSFAVLNHIDAQIPLTIGWVFITPDLHRRHHMNSGNPKNFGTVFSFWDRFLGYLDSGFKQEQKLGLSDSEKIPETWSEQFLSPFNNSLRSTSLFRHFS